MIKYKNWEHQFRKEVTTMKKLWLLLLILGIIFIGISCQQQQAPPAQPTLQEEGVKPAPAEATPEVKAETTPLTTQPEAVQTEATTAPAEKSEAVKGVESEESKEKPAEEAKEKTTEGESK